MVIIGLALLLRPLFLSHSFWTSEASDFLLVFDPDWFGPMTALRIWIFRGWASLFGTSEAAARSFSVLASAGAIFLLHRLASDLVSPAAGRWAAVVLAISAADFFHAREARYFEFHLLTSLLFLHEALLARRTTRTLLLGILCLLYYPFFLPNILWTLLVARRGIERLTLRGLLGDLLVIAPAGLLALLVIQRLDLRPFSLFITLPEDPRAYLALHVWSDTQIWRRLASTYTILVAGPVRITDLLVWGGAEGYRAIGLAAAALLAWALWTVGSAAAGDPELRRRFLYLLGWLLLQPLAYLYHQFALGGFSFVYRYALGTLPAVAILLGWALDLAFRRRRAAAVVAFGLYLLLSTSSIAAQLWWGATDSLYAWRRLLSQVAPHVEGRVLVLAQVDDPYIVGYYLRRGDLRFASNVEAMDAEVRSGGFDRVLVLPERIDPSLAKETTRRLGPPDRRWVARAPQATALNQPPVMTAEILSYRPRPDVE